MITDTDISLGYAPINQRLWVKRCEDCNLNFAGNYTNASFPTHITSNSTTEEPFWWGYWEELYRYYTVLSCEYEITVDNPRGHGLDVLACHNIETYGTTGSMETPKAQTLQHAMATKNLNWQKITSRAENGHTQIFKGTYKPGTAYRDIVNDGDVKLWTEVGSTPTLKECLRIWFYRHPLAAQQNTLNQNTDMVPTIVKTTTTDTPAPAAVQAEKSDLMNVDYQFHANIQIRLKYIVQFKGLIAAAQYPGATNVGRSNIPAVWNQIGDL